MPFIPTAKMSKRDRAAMNKIKRNTWSVSSVTRVKPSAKIYSRKKGYNYD